MNLQLLFKEQQLLRDKIAYNGPDRFEKLVLALLVELGECANEWRGFKFWSKNQKPRTKIFCIACHGTGENYHPINGVQITCPHCDGEGIENTANPLLEEYVDGFHFVLELGIELEIDITQLEWDCHKAASITKQFTDIYYLATYLQENQKFYAYDMLIHAYIQLGEMLGFTWEQIEQAYMEKNAINHERQEQGY